MDAPERPNQHWSMDLASDQISDDKCFRVLDIVDDFNRECIKPLTDP